MDKYSKTINYTKKIPFSKRYMNITNKQEADISSHTSDRRKLYIKVKTAW